MNDKCPDTMYLGIICKYRTQEAKVCVFLVLCWLFQAFRNLSLVGLLLVDLSMQVRILLSGWLTGRSLMVFFDILFLVFVPLFLQVLLTLGDLVFSGSSVVTGEDLYQWEITPPNGVTWFYYSPRSFCSGGLFSTWLPAYFSCVDSFPCNILSSHRNYLRKPGLMRKERSSAKARFPLVIPSTLWLRFCSIKVYLCCSVNTFLFIGRYFSKYRKKKKKESQAARVRFTCFTEPILIIIFKLELKSIPVEIYIVEIGQGFPIATESQLLTLY